ncbi:helix-turn-helix domain-containing protein, partial [Betaproteobacteria bacterium PRO7]|nr:helix-turn-helix domain-containing protein [Betaproteobacteria bacterium PRO7]
MDSLIAAAARALAVGDALEALKRIALRDDPPALALREVDDALARIAAAKGKGSAAERGAL